MSGCFARTAEKPAWATEDVAACWQSSQCHSGFPDAATRPAEISSLRLSDPALVVK
jgi:hypothetical protein